MKSDCSGSGGAHAGMNKKMGARFIERQQPVFQKIPVRLENTRGMIVGGVLRPDIQRSSSEINAWMSGPVSLSQNFCRDFAVSDLKRGALHEECRGLSCLHPEICHRPRFCHSKRIGWRFKAPSPPLFVAHQSPYAALYSLRRLKHTQISDHSDCTASKPRRRKPQQPMTLLICPKTGSSVWLRNV